MADLDWLNTLQKPQKKANDKSEPLSFFDQLKPKVEEAKSPVPAFGEPLAKLDKNAKIEATLTIDDIMEERGWNESPLPSERDSLKPSDQEPSDRDDREPSDQLSEQSSPFRPD